MCITDHCIYRLYDPPIFYFIIGNSAALKYWGSLYYRMYSLFKTNSQFSRNQILADRACRNISCGIVPPQRQDLAGLEVWPTHRRQTYLSSVLQGTSELLLSRECVSHAPYPWFDLKFNSFKLSRFFVIKSIVNRGFVKYK